MLGGIFSALKGLIGPALGKIGGQAVETIGNLITDKGANMLAK